LLVLGAIGWAIVAAAAGDALGFSKEVGAFLAGVSLASTQFREAVSTRLVSVRDFLLLFFFLTLGAGLDLSEIGAQVGPAILFSLFVLIGNPIIVMAIMRFMGYRKRTGFLTGITVAQISEFSLIMGALGLSLGHIDSETMALITLVGLITIGVSTYLILYSHPIYERLSPLLNIFDSPNAHQEQREDEQQAPDLAVIIFGVGRYGGEIARELTRRNVELLAVDFDPQAVRAAQEAGVRAVYGDAEDPEFLQTLPLSTARWVVSTMPLLEENMTLLRLLRGAGCTGRIAVRSHDNREAIRFTAAGADLILDLFENAAHEAANELEQALMGSVTPPQAYHD
jgi:hypothetical protein